MTHQIKEFEDLDLLKLYHHHQSKLTRQQSGTVKIISRIIKTLTALFIILGLGIFAIRFLKSDSPQIDKPAEEISNSKTPSRMLERFGYCSFSWTEFFNQLEQLNQGLFLEFTRFNISWRTERQLATIQASGQAKERSRILDFLEKASRSPSINNIRLISSPQRDQLQLFEIELQIAVPGNSETEAENLIVPSGNEFWFDSTGIPEFIGILPRLAVQYNLNPADLGFGQTDTAGSSQLKLVLTGDYDSFRQFLGALEEIPRSFIIENIEVRQLTGKLEISLIIMILKRE